MANMLFKSNVITTGYYYYYQFSTIINFHLKICKILSRDIRCFNGHEIEIIQIICIFLDQRMENFFE